MPKISPTIDSVAGFQVSGVHAGLKKDGALDFSLVLSDVDCATAGVFTRNKVKAAPVLLDMERLRRTRSRFAVSPQTRSAPMRVRVALAGECASDR